MSMLENLIGSSVVRADEKRIIPTRRPLPTRPREVFDLFVSLGAQASIASLQEVTEMSKAEPRTLISVVLNRWPVAAELDAFAERYLPRRHLAALLLSQEFRTCLFHRICDAYPERPRQLFVRIPRCAGTHFLATVGTMHPAFPPDLAQWAPRDSNRFIPALGAYMSRFTLTRSIMAVQPTLAAFTHTIEPPALTGYESAGLGWFGNAAIRRMHDRLFTIVRDPLALIVGAVNATLDDLLRGPGSDDATRAALRTRLPAVDAASSPENRSHAARALLRCLPWQNPICHALADGTAAGALAAARLQDIEIADLADYADWIKYTWDVEPPVGQDRATPHLTLAGLAPADLAQARSLVSEDLIFYEAFKTARTAAGPMRYAVRGREL